MQILRMIKTRQDKSYLDINNVSLAYDNPQGGSSVEALRSITFGVKKGEFVLTQRKQILH